MPPRSTWLLAANASEPLGGRGGIRALRAGILKGAQEARVTRQSWVALKFVSWGPRIQTCASASQTAPHVCRSLTVRR